MTRAVRQYRSVWEGEEEAGSPHIADILKSTRRNCADLWLIGDGPVHQSRAPTLYFGARGAIDLETTIYGPLHPLHDGHYGNWAPNPAAMAAGLITSVRDDKGRILIPVLPTTCGLSPWRRGQQSRNSHRWKMR